jgi:excisionase family DNA binding protein
VDYRDPDWVAEKLGLDRNTVYRFLHDGTIPAIQLGRKWLVSEGRLEEWLAAEMEKQTRQRREATRSHDPSSPARKRDQFTASARQVLRRAHSEARRHKHPRLDQSHLLLGLAEEQNSATARSLRSLGITPDVIRLAIHAHLLPGETVPARRLSRTPEAKRAMRLAARLAARESRGAGGTPLAPIGTDHLLTGILLTRRGLGHQILAQHHVTRDRLRQALHTEGVNP